MTGLMYQLRKGTLNSFDVNREEKTQKSVYLYEWQWELLEEVSENSINQALRLILSNYFDAEETEPRLEATLSVLERIYAETSDSNLKDSINSVESAVLQKQEVQSDV